MQIKKLKITAILMTAILCFTFLSACSSKHKTTENTGEFSMQDLNDNTYTESMFQDYDLTMVNVFTTWCTPCVEELPYLEELSQTMALQGVQIVGVVLDTLDDTGSLDEEVVEKAQLLAEKSGVTYPLLIPDDGYMNGMLEDIDSVPYTFFVDKDGNILGDTVGSSDLEGWTEMINEQLEKLK